MPSIHFGIRNAPDFIEKARRELRRYEVAENPTDRGDHALNLAITVHHLADWVFHHGLEKGVEMGNAGDFLGKARNANESVRLLHKIADTIKHHTLNRQNVLDIAVDEVDGGRLVVHQDYFGINLQPPIESIPGGKFLGVRTIIDDDEIIGYQSIFEGIRVTSKGVGQFLDPICEEAIAFWDDVIRRLDAGHPPVWL